VIRLGQGGQDSQLGLGDERRRVAPAGFDPFEALMKKENEILAGDLMTQPEVLVDEDKGVVELAALMLQRNIRRVMVVSGGELVGLIMRSDIVSRVIRG